MTERYTMTEKILDVLKSFSEIFDRHLVPAVLSFVLGIAVYLYVGDTYWMVNRLSTVVFVAFVACIAFFVYHASFMVRIKGQTLACQER